jgi:hypothetical protein
MAGIEVVHAADVGQSDSYVSKRHHVEGGSRSKFVSPADYSLWLVAAELEDGATIEWPAVHGDEAVMVLSGGFEIDGKVCPPQGAAIIESDVATRGRALGPTRIVHVGPSDPAQPLDGLNGPPDPDGHSVHVYGPKGHYASITEGSDSHYYADSSCPTCRLTLLYLRRDFPHEAKPHAHSEDELIHVLTGELILGSQHVGPGDTLAISKKVRYRFRGADTGFSFVNYRRDASQHIEPSGAGRMEGGRVNNVPEVLDLIKA